MALNFEDLDSVMNIHRDEIIDDITIASCILDIMRDSGGAINFNNINSPANKDKVDFKLMGQYALAHDTILMTFYTEGKKIFYNDYFEYVWRPTGISDDKKTRKRIKKYLPYNPRFFMDAINNLHNQGIPIFITNYRSRYQDVWDEYKRLMLQNPEARRIYQNMTGE